MIFVKGYGQMCNNILQYAHIYAWGRENRIKVISMRFSYKYQYFDICNRKCHNWSVYVFAKILIKLHFIKHLWLEDAKDITPDAIDNLKHDKMIALSGWSFRFPDLFFKYEDEIKRLFAIKEPIRKRVDDFFASCENPDVRLAVHIRRGDYARFLGGIYYFGDEVYARNITEFISLFPGKKVSVFICTNDKNFDLGVYRKKLGTESIHLFRGNEGEDLYLLSQCDYIIGAKSTFSLVASFYRHLPIYHIVDSKAPLSINCFKYFEDLFMFA